MLSRAPCILSLSGVGGNLFPRSYRCAVFVASRRTAVSRSEVFPTLPCYKLPSHRNFSICNTLSLRATDCIRAADEVGKMKTETAAAGATETKLSQSQRLKQAVKEYGATVIVFHTCISLFTLGVAYAAVSRYPVLYAVLHQQTVHITFNVRWLCCN